MGFVRKSGWGLGPLAIIVVVIVFGVLVMACGKKRSPATPAVQSFSVEEQLAQLSELVPPAGVDAALFQGLKDALAAELKGRGVSKLVSGPPDDAPTLTATPGAGTYFTLRWQYRSTGDYNQDSFVNILDITPLAAHFNQSIGDFPGNEVIDGNGDSVINISDLTPLAANFSVDCAGYQVQRATSLSGTFELLDTVAFGDAIDDGGRKRFEYDVDASTYHAFKVVAVDGSGGLGAESNVVQASAAPPDITDVSPDSGNAGAEITFVAIVMGSQPMTYQWNFGGGADPNTADTDTPYATVTLGDAGEYDGSLTATNSLGEDSTGFHYEVIYVGEPPDITSVSPTSGSPGQEVTFTATVTGDEPISYDWNFGDGATPGTPHTDVPEVTVTLSDTAADYPSSLTATNSGGSDNYPFTLHISSVNHPPTVEVTVNGDIITADADDIDGDPLSFGFALMMGIEGLELVPETIPPTTEYTQTSRLYVWLFTNDQRGGAASCTVDDGVNDPVKGEGPAVLASGQWGLDNSINITTVTPGDSVQDSVKVNEELRTIVYFIKSSDAVREFPAVRIEFDDKLDVDPADSYNVGDWGETADFADGGFWWPFDTANHKILPTPDNYVDFGPFDANYYVDGVPVPAGRKYIDVSALPDGGSYAQPAGGHGYIFNFRFKGVSPGTAHVRIISQYSDTPSGPTEDATYYTSSTGGAHVLFDHLDELDIEVTN